MFRRQLLSARGIVVGQRISRGMVTLVLGPEVSDRCRQSQQGEPSHQTVLATLHKRFNADLIFLVPAPLEIHWETAVALTVGRAGRRPTIALRMCEGIGASPPLGTVCPIGSFASIGGHA